MFMFVLLVFYQCVASIGAGVDLREGAGWAANMRLVEQGCRLSGDSMESDRLWNIFHPMWLGVL